MFQPLYELPVNIVVGMGHPTAGSSLFNFQLISSALDVGYDTTRVIRYTSEDVGPIYSSFVHIPVCTGPRTGCENWVKSDSGSGNCGG